jgi:dolichyl-phosphate-mannose-protein mannosyltransferase
MGKFSFIPRTDDWPAWRLDLIAVLVTIVGVGIRFWAASASFVNPDEAYHALLSTPETFGALYESAIRSPHPPMLVVLLHYVRQISTSDLALRSIPLIAGTLMPWVVYRWISRGWSQYAGLGALAILMLAPEIIRLSVEARGYTIALLFMACALYLLDLAIDRSSPLLMVLFALSLYGAILTEYSVVFFVVASGVYFLARIMEQRVTTPVRVTWELSQVGAVVVYSILWVTQVDPLRAIETSRTDIEGWLSDSYLQPDQNPLVFAVLNTAKQFAYLLPSTVTAIGGMLLFGLALYLLWRRRPEGSIWHSRATILLLVTPFAVGCASAMIHLFPYGRTRHSAILAVFVATGICIAVDRIGRRWIVPLVLIAMVAAPVWHWQVGQHLWEIARTDERKQYMEESISFLKKSIPPGSVILTESEFRVVLAYYLDTGVRIPEINGVPSEETTGGWRLFCGRWNFTSMDDLKADLNLMRQEYGLSPDERIWVLDGGFESLLEPSLKQSRDQGEVTELFQFRRAMVAALTPAAFLWDESAPPVDDVPEAATQ